MTQWLRSIAAGIAAGTILLLLARSGEAAHVQGWNYYLQDTGRNSSLDLPGVLLLGVNDNWITAGQPFGICADWDPLPPEIADAIQAWDSVLPDAQFASTPNCPGSYELNVLKRSEHSTPPHTSCYGAFACADWEMIASDQREGSYSSDANDPARPVVWVNDLGYSFTSAGLRAVVTHELGHIFGLHEAYLHDEDYSPSSQLCNPNIASVMDRGDFTNDQVSGPCPGDPTTPNVRDITAVQTLYGLVPPSVTSESAVAADLTVTFTDENYAEARYGMDIYYVDYTVCCDGVPYYKETLYQWNGIAPIGRALQFTWRKPSSASFPEGFYRICVFAESAMYTTLATCAFDTWASSDPQVDSDGDGWTDYAEGGGTFCFNIIDDDDDGLINDGCPTIGGLRELPNQCANSANDDVGDDDVVNDGCILDAFGEADLSVGTDPQDNCGFPYSPVDPSGEWPGDLVSGGVPSSTIRMTIHDLLTFIAPTRRLGSSPNTGNPAFDHRWDLAPGKGIFTSVINIADLITLLSGDTGYPPMFNGQRAFNGPECPWE